MWITCLWEEVYEVRRVRIGEGRIRFWGNNNYRIGYGGEIYIGDLEEVVENKKVWESRVLRVGERKGVSNSILGSREF